MFEEYWTGKGIDYLGAWADFEEGQSYMQQFRRRTVYVLQLEFEGHPEYLPLFDHEAILKTVKGCFHDLKLQNLTRREYEIAIPIFLYDIRRGSAIWNFLGELRQLLMFGTTLSDEKLKNQRLENWNKKLEILREHFGKGLSPDDLKKLMNAETPPEVDRAMKRLIRQGLKAVKVSKEAFHGEIDSAEESMFDLKLLSSTKDSDRQLRRTTDDADEEESNRRLKPRAIGEADEESE